MNFADQAVLYASFLLVCFGLSEYYRYFICFNYFLDRFLWLACFCLACSLHLFCESGALRSAEVLILLTGFVLAGGTKLSVSRFHKPHCFRRFLYFWSGIFLIILVSGEMYFLPVATIYQYHGQLRWSGIWESPNVFGILMGVGVVIACSILWRHSREMPVEAQVKDESYKIRNDQIAEKMFWVTVVFIALVAGGLATGLFMSQSRGAWIATIIALCFLSQRVILCSSSNSKSLLPGACVLWLKRNVFAVWVVFASVAILCFWEFRQTNWQPAQRAFSATKMVDFSWRNRLAGWEGTLQITAEHPWYGAGWKHPELLYENFYMPRKLPEFAAIETNDYLLLGSALGVPALFCFGMYVWLTLSGNRYQGPRPWVFGSGAEKRQAEGEFFEVDWLRATCHAGAIVLLAGFWFDGGLLKLPTAATFWILLELGACAPCESDPLLVADAQA